MVRELFFVSYSRVLQICINFLEGAQLALDHCEIRKLRHRQQEDSSIKLCSTFFKVLNFLESLIDNDKIMAGPRVLHSNYWKIVRNR